MKTLFAIVCVVVVVITGGCVHCEKRSDHTAGQAIADVQAAIQCVRQAYPLITVTKIDERTIAVIWEVRRDEKFEKLRAAVKTKYHVETIIGAIE